MVGLNNVCQFGPVSSKKASGPAYEKVFFDECFIALLYESTHFVLL